MPQYAKETNVSTDQSRIEIEKTLRRYGATSFAYGWEGDRAMIGFEYHDRRYRIVVQLPDPKAAEFRYTPARRTLRSQQAANEAWEQACRQRWRALALVIKATLEGTEAGIVTVEQVLMNYTVLPNGRTVGEWLAPQLEQAYRTGQMPPMLPGLPSGKEQ